MTVTGEQILATAHTMLTATAGWQYEVDTEWDPVGGNQYRLTGARKTTDCSGFIFLSCKAHGLVTPTLSSTLARWCHAAGLDRVPVAEALRHPAYLLFRGDNFGYDGWGPKGHVAFTNGDGVNVCEAEGHQRDILIDPAEGGWTNASPIPGVDYSASGGGSTTHLPDMIEGNPMYGPNDICDVHSDGAGHAWGLTPSGAVLTLIGDKFYGAYGTLRDAAGHPLPARGDFASITPRFDGKAGYTLWPLHYSKGMRGYSFPTG